MEPGEEQKARARPQESTVPMHPDCAACNALRRDVRPPGRDPPAASQPSTPLASVAAATKAGCPCCVFLTAILAPYTSQLAVENDSISISGEGKALGLSVVRTGEEESTPPKLELDVFSSQRRSCEPCWCHGRRRIGDDEPSDGVCGPHHAARQIVQWMKLCRAVDDGAGSDHSTCRETLDAQRLPTRVLYIAGEEHVRLHVSRPGETARYACLSYCWGRGGLPITTTTANLYEHEKRIDWSALPTTFQDAVEVCRRLGIAYLWIDSLCIIQDDPDDWRNEAGLMATVYSQAFITIAAANSPNAYGGLFNLDSGAQKYTFEGVINRPSQIYVRRRPDNDLDNAPLMSRGWVLQERLLSPRIVHFGRSELQWECMGASTCECGHNHHGSYIVPGSMLSKSERMVPSSAIEVVHRWVDIVGDYTRLSLTYEDDVFPAIQGIAQLMQSERRCGYFAGLWEDTLLIDLLWHRDKNSTSARRVRYQAPTWSWASCTGRIRLLPSLTRWAKQFVSKAVVESVSTTPLGSSPLGAIIGGRLCLTGSCLSARLDHEDCALHARDAVESSRIGYFFSDVEPCDIPGDSVGMVTMLIGSFAEFHFCLIFLPSGRLRGSYERVGYSFWNRAFEGQEETLSLFAKLGVVMTLTIE